VQEYRISCRSPARLKVYSALSVLYWFLVVNSVHIGLGSTSATWDRVSPILGVPPLVSNFESIRT